MKLPPLPMLLLAAFMIVAAASASRERRQISYSASDSAYPAADEWEEEDREQHLRDLLRRAYRSQAVGGYRQVPVSRAASHFLSRRPPSRPALEALFVERKRAAEAATELKTDDGLPERQGRDWMTRLG